MGIAFSVVILDAVCIVDAILGIRFHEYTVIAKMSLSECKQTPKQSNQKTSSRERVPPLQGSTEPVSPHLLPHSLPSVPLQRSHDFMHRSGLEKIAVSTAGMSILNPAFFPHFRIARCTHRSG